MSSAAELLTDLSSQGVQLWVENDQLRLRAPAGMMSDALRARLAEHKQEILALLRERTGTDQAKTFAIEPAPQDRYLPFPLTDIQRAYWVGRQQAFDLGDVSIHFYTEVDCLDLDMDRLQIAWHQVVARHEMLRAVVGADGEQRILPSVPPYQIAVADLRGRSAEEAEAALAATREELSHQVLPTDRWPAFEIRVSLLDGGKSRLHYSVDCLNADAASLLLTMQDWVHYYKNPAADLPALELCYRDYCLADLALHDSAEHQRGLDYWKRRVTVLPPSPELPLVKSPGSIQQTRFRRWNTKMSAESYQRLRKRSTQMGITPSVFFCTAFADVLANWSKSPDFTINVTLFNRLPVHPQVYRIVGDFTSMILLGATKQAEGSFLERAKRLQEQLWNDLEYRYVSGIKVLGELNKFHRRTSGGVMPVVFTSLLDIHAQGFSGDMLSGLGEEAYTITQTPQLYLDHQLKEDIDGGVDISWDVVEDLFPPGVLDDMFTAYGDLLRRLDEDESAWTEPRRPLLPPAQAALLAEVNRTEAPIPDETLYTLFTAQAARQPEAPAVLTPQRSLTYGELLRRATRLGHRLRQLGVEPDTLVAVVMEKGWEQAVGVLGIHAAGAAYVPIDPGLPQERRWFLLEHSGASVALTQSWLDERLEWPDNVQRISVDTDDLTGVPDLDRPIAPVQTPAHLSHVIYTSGSTGQPKGVMIEHRNVVNRMLDVNERCGIGPSDRAIAVTALHHDLSVSDIFGMLAAGGAMVIPDAEHRRDPAHWAELMVREKVTFWNSVPAFLEMLVEHLEHSGKDVPTSLRTIILAGDWIPVSLPGRVRAFLPDVRFIASGGPTETTIWDIWNPVGEVDPSWKSIPYGKPMRNTKYHVLNAGLDPCPVWVPGELYISGAGLARGYWRDEEKTREKFLIHPRTGERIYRSGDWGRWLPDGNIEFLGREDAQIKIRGQRIELGEIESALNQHPAVQSSVVTVADLHGARGLMAYVVPVKKRSAQADGQQATAVFSGEAEITDPLERLQFKLSHPNLRPVNGAALVPLSGRDEEGWTAPFRALRSHRQFEQGPISQGELSRFLSCLAAIEVDGLDKYQYGSGGGLYPVQTYLYIKPGRVEGLEGGLYYYNPREHGLSLITPNAVIDREAHFPVNQATFDESAFSVFLIGKRSAIEPLYGDLWRDFCLIEAGMISQALRASGAESGIGLCQLGGVKFDLIRHLFDIDDQHVHLQSLLGGAALAEEVHTGADVPAARLPEELRIFLRTKLPEHMVPLAFVVLDALPLTPNGKVDRNALPDPNSVQLDIELGFVAPADELEARIAEVWQKVMNVDKVGVTSNFFDLGANSLAVVKFYHALRDELKRDFPLITMFRRSTIRALAQFLSEDKAEEVSFEQSRERAETRRARMQQRRQLRRSDSPSGAPEEN